MKTKKHPSRGEMLVARSTTASIFLVFWVLVTGCGVDQEAKSPEFFTSGSREADQRAEQRVARTQEMRGRPADEHGSKGEAAKKSLYERLGGMPNIEKIVDDFVDRAIADPRVNWERKGVRDRGIIRRKVEWQATDDNMDNLKRHMAQFLALATGGPAQYSGRDIKELHRNMRITNPEFDATVGVLKATLDKFHVPAAEQKELLAIVESTRPQIVVER
jgi:hemoglobin